MRLTKTPAQYLASKGERREHSYEAMLASGRCEWRRGERVRVYRTQAGLAGVVNERSSDVEPAHDPRDYDVDHYLRVLRGNFAVRLARAFTAEDFTALFADPDRPSLFPPAYDSMRAVLRQG